MFQFATSVTTLKLCVFDSGGWDKHRGKSIF